MTARLTVQDVIANNLANANSTGFQRELTAFTNLTIAPAGDDSGDRPAGRGAQAILPTTLRDTRPGVIEPTGNAGDIALDGPGYLTVQTPGGVRLQRSAALHADRSGLLVTSAGLPVLSSGGQTISVGSGAFTIADDGTVSTHDGRSVGRIRVVQTSAPVQADEAGGGLIVPTGTVTEVVPGSVPIRSGYRERSNVEPVREMVDMIASMRAYEAGQRSIQSQDQTLQNLFSLLQG
jgi:flagellar basal body rod protein FlgG